MSEQTGGTSVPSQQTTSTVADTSNAELSANTATDTEAVAPAVEAEIKKYLNKIKIKVDGEESEEELPFDVEEGDEATIKYLQKQAQLAKMSQKRAQEAAQTRNHLMSIIEQLKTNPRKILSDPNIGVDIKKLAADIINEEIERSQLTPEQLKIKEMEDELTRIKAEREEQEETRRQEEFGRLQEQEYDRYDMLFTKALEGSDLPKSPYVVKKMADYMLLGIQNGYDVTPEMILPLVREEIHGDIKGMFGAMPDEVLENFVDKQTYDRIRKRNLAKVKDKPPVPVNRSLTDVVKPDKNSKNDVAKKSYKEFFKLT